jgi:uncharacterized protein YeaO (DUF488 family)
MIKTKRVYESPSPEDGLRILVDRLWPRGLSKEQAHVNSWYKEIAPSNELRTWFGHKPELFKEFSKKYTDELKNQKSILSKIKELAQKEQITLLYSAKDTKYNNAIVLKKILEE